MYLTTTDNFLDFVFIEELKYEFLYNTPHIFGTTSNNKKLSKPFYHSDITPNNFLIQYIHQKINKEILNLNTEIIRSYINIQHKEMEGNFHTDDGDITALLMVTDTPNDNGGKFEYKWENGEVKTEDFIQNRLILFQKIEHRGCAPTNGEPRITLALKLKFIDNEV